MHTVYDLSLVQLKKKKIQWLLLLCLSEMNRFPDTVLWASKSNLYHSSWERSQPLASPLTGEKGSMLCSAGQGPWGSSQGPFRHPAPLLQLVLWFGGADLSRLLTNDGKKLDDTPCMPRGGGASKKLFSITDEYANCRLVKITHMDQQ